VNGIGRRLAHICVRVLVQIVFCLISVNTETDISLSIYKYSSINVALYIFVESFWSYNRWIVWKMVRPLLIVYSQLLQSH